MTLPGLSMKVDRNEKDDSVLGRILTPFKRSYLTEIEVVLFGFALVLGNRNITWNQALVYGFDSYLFNLIFVGSAYVCLCLCMGEMTSALPFSGGIFGYVRAAAGPYLGYVTAWFEIAFILTYIIIKVDQVMKIMVALKLMTTEFIPYAVVIFYTSSFAWNVIGGKAFWGLVSLLGFGTFCLYLIYLGGVADASVHNPQSVDYKTFCKTTVHLPLSMENIMPGRTSINGFYQGLHFIPLLSDSLKNPRQQIPRALMICSLSFVLLSIFLSLSACSQYPGMKKLIKTKYPLQYGFSNVFNVSLVDSIWFNVPGMYAVAFCLYYCAGKQIHAISKSGLLFEVFSWTTPVLNTPYVSYFTACCIGVCLNVYVFFYIDGYAEIRNVAVLASHIVFSFAFLAYLLFSFRYSSLTRSFHSPLGIWGAIYGFGNYFIGIVGLIWYSGNTYNSVYALLALFGVVTLFYWFYMVGKQQFSEEEKKLMFKAYLINANRDKRIRILNKKNLHKVGVLKNTETKMVITSELNVSDIPDESNEVVRPVERVNEVTQSGRVPAPSLSVAARSRSFYSYHQMRGVEVVDRVSSSEPHSHKSHMSRMSFTSQISHFFSGKMNSVFPIDLMEQVDGNKEYKQMMILAAGGILNPEEEESLKEKLGLDVEASGCDANAP